MMESRLDFHGVAPRRALRAGFMALAAVAWPVAALAQQEHGEGAAGGALFDINVGLSLWTVVVFLALLLVLWRYAWGPILGAVEAREDRIQGALDESARQREEAAALLEEHKRQLADARRQAQEIVAEGKAAGQKLRREIEEKAREEGQALLERARVDIQREKEEALAELRKESVDLALAAAARLIRQKLDGERDRELVLGYVDELTARESTESTEATESTGASA